MQNRKEICGIILVLCGALALPTPITNKPTTPNDDQCNISVQVLNSYKNMSSIYKDISGLPASQIKHKPALFNCMQESAQHNKTERCILLNTFFKLFKNFEEEPQTVDSNKSDILLHKKLKNPINQARNCIVLCGSCTTSHGDISVTYEKEDEKTWFYYKVFEHFDSCRGHLLKSI